MNNTSDFFPEENKKEYFLENLPDMAAASLRAWSKISQGAWSDLSFSKLYELITDITSKSSFHDLPSLHQQALAIQDYLKLFISKNATPSSTQIAEIDQLFEKLATVQQQTLDDFEQSQQPVKRLIYVISSKDEICSKICNKLDNENYNSVLFSEIDAGIDKIQDTIPNLIILETDNIDELSTIHDALVDSDHNRVPIILISHRDDTSTRLIAMRSGVSRYFAPPHDVEQISNEIDILCEPKKAQHHKVLIIEDDPTQAEFASTILKKASMVTQIVTHPLQVMDALKNFAPDIILMDIYMPDADGLELTTIIRDDLQYLATPIIFLSGETDQDKQIDALMLGGDDFISKPIRPKHLIATIKNRIRRTHDLIHAIKLQVATEPASLIQLSPDESNRIIESDYLSDKSPAPTPDVGSNAPLTEAEILSEKIRVALGSENFKMLYQPILCVHGQSDNNYSVIMTMPDGDNVIRWDDMAKATQGKDIQTRINQQALQFSLNSITELTHQDKQGIIFLPQTIFDIKNNSDANWIRDALRAHRMVGTNLVMEYNLNELAPYIKNTKEYFSILKDMGIKICLSEFPAKKAAFKLLQYLRADYIKTGKKLLETESDVINTYVNQAHRLKTKVIVANLSDPRYVNLHWTTLADYLQGDFISPASDSMNFNFSQAAL
jgi:DNA-binding response OmpR family regulator/EAL domain-containing protein (putative c-di-GMP-specific phosphodiesterase class I)